MGTTKVTMIRHGETEWNVSMRLQGKKNSELTSLGLKQIELVAEALSQKSFDILISSDQKRAVNTAEIINKYFHLNIVLNENLRERNFGIMEGLTREEIAKKFPEVHDGYIKRKSEFQVPDGESLIQLFSRVTSELKNIINLYEGKSILIVTHGGVLDCTMRMVFSLSLDRSRNFSIYNAAINTFIVTDGQWNLDEWGNIDHLKGTESFAELNQKNNRIYY